MTTEKSLIDKRFKSHTELHAATNMFRCSKCNEPFKYGHMGTRHGEDFPREYCDMCFGVITRPCCGDKNPLFKLSKLAVRK